MDAGLASKVVVGASLLLGGFVLGSSFKTSAPAPAAAAADSENETPFVTPNNNLIDGKAVSKVIRDDVKAKTQKMKATHGVTPGLAVVIVGNRQDSEAYVRMKHKAAENIGFNSIDVKLPEDVSEDELVAKVEELNNDPQVHGILVQLPLPKHIDSHRVLTSISVEKDADGFHALNVGNLWIQGGDPPLAVACTPAGCMELLKHYGVEISGKDCVVLGRSNIVGMPMCALLQAANGTVTCCHSRTKDIAEKVRRADIVIAAVGRPEMVRGDWIKPGAVVIDVGIHQVGTTESGKRKFCGDVLFNEVAPKCKLITPVPGGVGPMTIAMLCKNTFNLACHSIGIQPEDL